MIEYVTQALLVLLADVNGVLTVVNAMQVPLSECMSLAAELQWEINKAGVEAAAVCSPLFDPQVVH